MLDGRQHGKQYACSVLRTRLPRFSTDVDIVTRFVTTDCSLRIAAADAAAGVPGGRAGGDVRPERNARARAAGPAGGAPGGQAGRRRRAAPAPPHAPPQASLLYFQRRLRHSLIPCTNEAVVQRLRPLMHRLRGSFVVLCKPSGNFCCPRAPWQRPQPGGQRAGSVSRAVQLTYCVACG